jgi:hypothetical protein
MLISFKLVSRVSSVYLALMRIKSRSASTIIKCSLVAGAPSALLHWFSKNGTVNVLGVFAGTGWG